MALGQQVAWAGSELPKGSGAVSFARVVLKREQTKQKQKQQEVAAQRSVWAENLKIRNGF